MLSRNKVAVPEGAAGSPPFKRSSERVLSSVHLYQLSVENKERERYGSLAQLVRASS